MKINIILGMVVSLSMLQYSHAQLSWGDANTDQGSLSISGYVRANYEQKDYGYSASDGKIEFDAAQLKIDYQSPHWFGRVEYRCYQYDSLCDFSTLVDGYLGYKLNPQLQVTFGIQPIPFGPARYWESSLYGGINNTIGLEDAHNLGINLNWNIEELKTKIDVAYFAQDGGHYQGSSRDSARYTANLVKTRQAGVDQLSEENMWIGRVLKQIDVQAQPELQVSTGASYWYSDIKSELGQDGKREAWSAFGQLGYQGLNLMLTAGQTHIKGLTTLPNYAVFGSYDSEYWVANKADFYTADLSYAIKTLKKDLTLTPYLMHSRYDKKNAQDQTSQRNILGLGLDYQRVSLIAEYIFSKNDPFIGGNAYSLAQGDDGQWNKLLNLTLFYRF